MQYSNFDMKNNVHATLSTAVSSVATTIQLTAGQGSRFGTTFPQIATLESIENGKVMKREIVKITGRSGDNLTVVRAFAPCPSNDDANSQTQTAISFNADDTISLYIPKEIFDKIHDSLNDIYDNGTNNLRTELVSGLEVEVNAGSVLVGSAYYDFAGGTIILTDNATNYLEIDEDGNLANNTSDWNEENTKLAIITTSDGSVTNIKDRRLGTVGGKIGGLNIHELTEKEIIDEDDEFIVADSENIYQNKRTIAKNMGFRKMIDRVVLGEDVTAGDYAGAFFYGQQNVLQNTGANTTKNIGNSSSDYMEFSINSENHIIQKMLLDPLTIVGSGGGELTVTFTGLETGMKTTLTISQTDATATGGFDIAGLYQSKYGNRICCKTLLTIKIEQKTVDGSNYYTTNIDTNSKPNYTIRDGLETGKARLSNSDYQQMNKFDGIVLKSGTAGQIVPVQIGGIFDLTSGLYNSKKLYINNKIIGYDTVEQSVSSDADYRGSPNFGTFTNVGTINMTLYYNAGSASGNRNVVLSIGGEQIRSSGSFYLNSRSNKSFTVELEFSELKSGALTMGLTQSPGGTYWRGGSGTVGIQEPIIGHGFFDDTENVICIGEEKNGAINLQRKGHTYTLPTPIASGNDFSFGENGFVFIQYSMYSYSGNQTSVYLDKLTDIENDTRTHVWSRNSAVSGGYTASEGGSDIVPIEANAVYKVTGTTSHGSSSYTINVVGFMQI